MRQDRSMVSKDSSIAHLSDAGGKSNSEDTDLEVGFGMARISKPKGVRSLSIQNNSTKASAMQDVNFSDDNSRKHQVRISSAETLNNAAKIGNPREAALTRDIMELISEEELSVCRSEGSPPGKAK